MNRNWHMIASLGEHKDLRKTPRMSEPIRTGADGRHCQGYELQPKMRAVDYGAFAERNAKKEKTGCADISRRHTVHAENERAENADTAINHVAESAGRVKSEHAFGVQEKPLASDPTSAGWELVHSCWHKQQHLIVKTSGGWKSWSRDDWTSLQTDCSRKDKDHGALFSDWRLIDELLFETEPQSKDGWRVGSKGFWHHISGCVVMKHDSLWSTLSIQDLISWVLLKQAMRKAGIIK